MPPGESPKEAVESKTKNSRRLIIVLLALILFISAGSTYLFFFNGSNHGAAEAGVNKSRKNMQKFSLDAIVVNLADPGLRRYLRTKITLEYSDPRLTSELEDKVYRTRDSVISVLRNKKTEDLQDEDALKQELVAAINVQLDSGQVEGLYFEEFLVQ